ncbi:hypothetical protein CEXT_607571 [Caerostris extrusa]|uniref:Uncharacterized protein n=1 Tax=Caerostris extrusa TaxID=172846 RepID=A0AAV4W7X5_CAEEX|nr:hypothetical protein CEXT_607571 [Caerostris extrusa]
MIYGSVISSFDEKRHEYLTKRRQNDVQNQGTVNVITVKLTHANPSSSDDDISPSPQNSFSLLFLSKVICISPEMRETRMVSVREAILHQILMFNRRCKCERQKEMVKYFDHPCCRVEAISGKSTYISDSEPQFFV